MKEKLIFLLIALAILHDGAVWFSQHRNELIAAITVLTFLYAFFVQFVLNSRALLYWLFLFSSLLFAYFLHGVHNEPLTYFKIAYKVMLALLLASWIKEADFQRTSSDIIFYLSAVSIPLWLLVFFIPDVIFYFPVVESDTGALYRNLFLYVATDTCPVGTDIIDCRPSRHFRNNSIFWEAGAFAGIAFIGLILELYSKSPRRYVLLVLVTALLSTFSTVAYLALILLLILYIFSIRQVRLNLKSLIVGFLIVCPFLVLVGINLIAKLSVDNVSFIIRTMSIVIDLSVFWENLPLGIGFEEYERVFSQKSIINL
jgi:hypothetical protein